MEQLPRELIDKIVICAMTHKKAFERWEEGEYSKHWIDENGVLCIKYESGKWWHYNMTDDGIEWW